MYKPVVESISKRAFAKPTPLDREREFYGVGIQANSNLFLQMTLYLNVRLFPVWLLIVIINLNEKYYCLTDFYKLFTILVIFVISILEWLRLYLGYLGNLAGKVPELATFWLISTLIQFPLEVYALFDGGTIQRFTEVFANSCVITLLGIEIVAGSIALKNLADLRAKRFYLAQLYGIDDKLNYRWVIF